MATHEAQQRSKTGWAPDLRASQRSERRLVQRAAAGDAQAFVAIVEQHYASMYGLALGRVGDAIEAEDLVQEALARAFCRLRQFNGGDRLSTWLGRIVVHACRDYLNSPVRNEQPAGARPSRAAQSANDADPQLARERDETVQRACRKLRPAYFEIVLLKDVMELSFEEIHALTGASIAGLKIRAIRARERLRTLVMHEQTADD